MSAQIQNDFDVLDNLDVLILKNICKRIVKQGPLHQAARAGERRIREAVRQGEHRPHPQLPLKRLAYAARPGRVRISCSNA